MSLDEKQNLPKILPVKSDLIFRIFFADERNEDDLISLLKSILRLPEEDYGEIEITDPHLLPEYVDDKYAIIDVKLKTRSQRVIHIEIQLKVTPELKKRIVFYSSKLITEQIGAGGNYNEIQDVISIIITDETLLPARPRYHHRFTFYDQEAGVELTDLVEIHAIELDKLPEDTDGTQLYDWASFIAAASEEELTVIAERNPQIGKAVVKLRQLSADEQTRDLFERREKARRDMESRERWARQEGRLEGRQEGRLEGRQEGRQEGRLEGRQEGRQEGIFAVAQSLLRMNLPIDQIAAATGLTHKEIEAQKDSL